ncbi:ABC transporter permease [Microbacteriaceae bacterium VKM Ac-2855]|nr:ABC transporter permease [Microbacteriaceae bacterium VKM Ac-2855]
MGFLSGLVGALVEAWTEVRIHKGRVLLSLIGVAVAVCALTAVVAAGGIAERSTIEGAERSSGRPATLYVYGQPADPALAGTPEATEVMNTVWQTTLDRYGVDYASRVIYGTQRVQFADGARDVSTTGVDQPYATMHRIEVIGGSWFAPDDADRFAPAVVINEIFWDRLGRPELGTHPTVALLGAETDATAVVVGVVASNQWEVDPSMFMLADAYARTAPAADPNFGPTIPNYEMWVPPEIAAPLADAVRRDVTAALGEGASVSVDRQDYAVYDNDPFGVLKLVVGGIAGLVLLLGALGLLNIALVTVRQRIREIGVRRSFGASSGRIFFAIMMESVVATVVAGFVGVTLAILLITNPIVRDLLSQGMVTDFPPFPLDAALLGLGASTVVGALAGLIPAIVAVRVKVIDAIRY